MVFKSFQIYLLDVFRNNGKSYVTVISLLFSMLLVSCGGGGDEGSGSGVTTNDSFALPPLNDYLASISPNKTLYGENPNFTPGQIILLESEMPFYEGEVFDGVDDYGSKVQLEGLQNGNAALIVPFGAEAGRYSLKISRLGVEYQLNLNLVSFSLPLNPEIYLNDLISRYISEIESILFEQEASADPELSKLLNDIRSIDLTTLSQDEITNIANFLYVNFENLETGNSPPSPALHIYKTQLTACSKYLIAGGIGAGFTIYAGATTLLSLGWAAPSFGYSGVPALVAGAITVVSGVATVKLFEMSLPHCSKETKARLNELGTSLQIKRQMLPNTGVQRIVYASQVSAPTFNYFDGDSKAFAVTVDEVPNDVLLQEIDKFKSGLASFRSALSTVSSSLVSRIENLGKPVTKDITNEVSFEQVNGSGVVCRGSASTYTCGFSDDGSIHDKEISFEFEVDHPDFVEPQIQNARVLPRGKPFIGDQSFIVVAGSGKEQRIDIRIQEDTKSPVYDLIKVTDYQLVSGPDYGYVSNVFTEPGILYYSADNVPGMPDSTQLIVKASNRYGWSDTAIITLKFDKSLDGYTLDIDVRYRPNGEFIYEDVKPYDPITLNFGVDYRYTLKHNGEVVQQLDQYGYAPSAGARVDDYTYSEPVILMIYLDQSIHSHIKFPVALTINNEYYRRLLNKRFTVTHQSNPSVESIEVEFISPPEDSSCYTNTSADTLQINILGTDKYACMGQGGYNNGYADSSTCSRGGVRDAPILGYGGVSGDLTMTTFDLPSWIYSSFIQMWGHEFDYEKYYLVVFNDKICSLGGALLTEIN